jgi:hypothetical protein
MRSHVVERPPRWNVAPPSEYRYLRKSGCTTLPGVNDKEEFQKMAKSMIVGAAWGQCVTGGGQRESSEVAVYRVACELRDPAGKPAFTCTVGRCPVAGAHAKN